MKDSDVMGIHFPMLRKFYYFENGQHTPGQTGVDRLRTVLIGRGLLNMTDENRTQHIIMSLAQAKLADVEIEIIYMNKHIKNQVTQQSKPHDLGTLWD